MDSKRYELFETPSTAAKIESSLTNPPPSEDHSPNVLVKDQEELVLYITGLKLFLVLLGVSLVAFLVLLDQTIIVTAIPKITVQFNSLKDIGKFYFPLYYTLD